MWAWIVEYWQFVVGTVIGLLGIAVGIGIAVWQRRPKQLDYELLSSIRLIHPQARALKTLAVTYDGNPIEDPRVVVVRIRSTGKQAVSADDFKGGEPITIRYVKGSYTAGDITEASAGVELTTVADIEWIEEPTEQHPDNRLVAITPRLLNPGEWFDVQLFSEGPSGGVRVASRFADRSRPMRNVDTLGPSPRLSLATSLVLGALVGGLALLLSWLTTINAAILAGALVFGGFFLLSRLSYRDLSIRQSTGTLLSHRK